MKYELNIRDSNLQAHMDIENDVQTKKNGQFTFILRVNGGNIADYVVMEYKDAGQFVSLKKVVIEEWIVTSNRGE